MSERELRDLIAYASEFCDRYFADHRAVHPIWLAVTSSGEQFWEVSPLPDKDLSIAMIRALFHIRDVVRYVFVDEAWTVARMLNHGEFERAQREGLEHFPGRIEVVMVSGEDRECGQLMAQREIIRPQKGKPYLGPLTMLEDLPFMPAGAHGESAGRLIGLLPVRGTRH